MNKCCVIIPYYGKWPSFFNLFLKSCSYNPALQVLFITDLSLPAAVCANVRKIHIPFNQLQQLFSEKLGVEVALSSYYKLCDFKPMYGFLFQEYIREVDFWGFGDIDLIYGNTRHFITDEVLKNYDLITYRTEWLSGALTLFRNNEYMNLLFRKSTDWNKVVTNSKHFSFTEVARQYEAIRNGTSVFDLKGEIISMTAVCKREALEGRIRYYEKKQIKENINADEFVLFDKGRVTDNKGNEYLHYHYITEKGKPQFSFPKWSVIPDIFYITDTGFYSREDFKYQPVTKYFKYVIGIGNYIRKKFRRVQKTFFKPAK